MKIHRGDTHGISPKRWKVFKLVTRGNGPFLLANGNEEFDLSEGLSKIGVDKYEYHVRRARKQTAKDDSPPLTRKLTELCRRYNTGDRSGVDDEMSHLIENATEEERAADRAWQGKQYEKLPSSTAPTR